MTTWFIPKSAWAEYYCRNRSSNLFLSIHNGLASISPHPFLQCSIYCRNMIAWPYESLNRTKDAPQKGVVDIDIGRLKVEKEAPQWLRVASLRRKQQRDLLIALWIIFVCSFAIYLWSSKRVELLPVWPAFPSLGRVSQCLIEPRKLHI